jgi:hypothetical protein
MKVGMTGNRDGLSTKQKSLCKEFLKTLKATEFHHGDCVGADAKTHKIAKALGLYIVVHPPEKKELRAFCDGDDIRLTKSSLARNRDIVHESEVMLGFPKTEFQTKGGTWYTIKYAKKNNRKLYIIYPSGNVEEFN